MLFHILWWSLTENGIKYYWALEIFTGIAQRSIKSCNGHSIFTVAFPNRYSPKENLKTNSYSKSHAEKNPISRNKTTISTGDSSWSHLLQFLSQNLHLLRKAIGTGWLCLYSSKSCFLFGVLPFCVLPPLMLDKTSMSEQSTCWARSSTCQKRENTGKDKIETTAIQLPLVSRRRPHLL